jgi:hypothetical protein
MELARAMEYALGEMLDGRPIDVGRILRDTHVIGKVHDRVLGDPLGGPANEVLAVLRSPEFEKILLERGPAALNKNGEIVVRGKDIGRMGYDASGFGLVKIIWRHGEKSETDPRFQVTREDAMRLPEIFDGYVPEISGRKRQGGRWSVDAGDGMSLVVAVGKRRGRVEKTTITLFRTNDTERYPHSPKREAPTSPTRLATKGQNADGDTPAGSFGRTVPEDPSGQRGQGLREESMPPGAEGVNTPIGPDLIDWRTETPEAFPPLPKSKPKDSPGDMLAEMGMETSGISREERFLAELEAEGGLRMEDRETLARAAEETERINQLERESLASAACVIRIAE